MTFGSHDRRHFFQVAVAAAASAMTARTSAQSSSGESSPRHNWHLRYAPELDWLPDLSFDEKLALYASYGFTAVEYNWLLRLPLSEVEQLRRTLDRHKVQLANFVVTPEGQGAKRVQITDRKNHEDYVAVFKTAIQYHKVAGNRHVVIDGGSYWGGSRFDQRQVLADAYKRIADLLEPTDLIAVIEPLSNPTAFFRTSEEIVEVLAAVNSLKIRLLFDLYHLQVTEGNLMAHMQQYWEYIAYVQTGDVPGRREPGTGEVNYRNIFKMMSDKGFTGIVGMEHQFSTPGREGLLKCFDAYRQVDTW